MGWTNSHLHQFRVGDTYYGTPDTEFGFEVKNERKVRLGEVLQRPKARMVYEYDFRAIKGDRLFFKGPWQR